MKTTNPYVPRRDTIRRAVDHMVNAMQGQGPNYAHCFPRRPSEVHPAGTLFPGGDGGTVRDIVEAYGRVSYTPTALGMKVNVARPGELSCELRVQTALFYPVVPTHDEAVQWLNDYGGNQNDLKFPYKYRRVELDVEIQTSIPTDEQSEFQIHPEATQQLQRALDGAAAQAATDPELAGVGTQGGAPATLDCTRSQILDPTLYAELFQQATLATPQWDGEFHYRVVREGDETFLEILLHNSTEKQAKRYEPAFVGTRLTLEAPDTELRPFRLREVEARDYRYDATTWATGRNTYAEGRLVDGKVRIETDSVPVYTQKRLRQRTWRNGHDEEIDTSFSCLAQDPLPPLESILGAMRDYITTWDDKAATVPSAKDEPDQVLVAKQEFEAEVERFAAGLARLRADKQILQSFKLMNQAFANRFGQLDPSGQAGWRLFQLVFIVCEIDDMGLRASGSNTDPGPDPTVLWFPTGGGKTEAYLGLIVWHAFWDRIRGKPFGTVAFAKFPLRMLSLQQFSRVVAVMEHAEEVRRNNGLDGDPFSVGYYAGSQNSENLIDWPVSPDGNKRSTISDWIKRSVRREEDRRKYEAKHRKVTDCPMCLTGIIETRFSEAKPGFTHTCRDCKRVLNLHVSDTEVLRWLPTLVIATVDKLARFAYEHWGRSLFGDIEAKCPDHGYLIARPAEGTRCPVLDCRQTLVNPPTNVDPVPALLIQDELHVLSESLGAMASHYETSMLSTMRRKAGCGPWKIIGSTATLEGYQHLIRHLYNYGSCHRFPAAGPTAEESFYIEQSDEDQRYVIGLRTHGMSHVDATMKVFLEYHRAMAPIFDPAGCSSALHDTTDRPPEIASEAHHEVAPWYRTVIGYGINKNEVSQVQRSFAGQLNAYCRREGLVEFEDERVDLLTGDTPIEKLQEWLKTVEGQGTPYKQAAAVTSLFALGVDIQWLNMIVFRGMPHGIAEYIQAMSRVGRKDGVPSIVVNVYNPNRERDASYFETHKKFLAFAPILIRHVPTTRFSKHALELTLPGVFMHELNYHNQVPEIWKKQSVAGAGKELRDNEARYLEAVRTALGIPDAPDPSSSLVLRQDEHMGILMGRLRAELLRKNAGINPMQESAKDRLKIPNSLRTTDETIRIYSSGTVGGDE